MPKPPKLTKKQLLQLPGRAVKAPLGPAIDVGTLTSAELSSPTFMAELNKAVQTFRTTGATPVEQPPTPGYVPSAPAPAPAGAPEPERLPDVEWKEGKFTLADARAPSWWKPFIPAKEADMRRPDVAFLAMLNASIPYLSPEDQFNAAAQLYAIDANHFASYKGEVLAPHKKQVITQATALLSDAYKRDPSKFTVMTPEMRRYYQSQERGEGFLAQLNELREQTQIARKNIAGTGIPYSWLQQVAGTQIAAGGRAGTGQTRAGYMQMIGALDPLLAQGQSAEVGGALGIGQMFARPFFGPQPLWPQTQTGGVTRFGYANPLLYA